MLSSQGYRIPPHSSRGFWRGLPTVLRDPSFPFLCRQYPALTSQNRRRQPAPKCALAPLPIPQIPNHSGRHGHRERPLPFRAVYLDQPCLHRHIRIQATHTVIDHRPSGLSHTRSLRIPHLADRSFSPVRQLHLVGTPYLVRLWWTVSTVASRSRAAIDWYPYGSSRPFGAHLPPRSLRFSRTPHSCFSCSSPFFFPRILLSSAAFQAPGPGPKPVQMGLNQCPDPPHRGTAECRQAHYCKNTHDFPSLHLSHPKARLYRMIHRFLGINL